MFKKSSYNADILIVGCGFAGSTFARLAAENNYTVHIIDKRNHIGGNCYSYEDIETGIIVHKYGPHIFHTNSKEVWKFINHFTIFNSYIHRVKAKSNGNIYSLPINLHTINQYFNKAFSPNEAKKFINKIRVKNLIINNFENYIISSLGEELYEAFFKYYTQKQWGCKPEHINKSTANRLPIRFNYNVNYFDDVYQGIPVDGYTKIFIRMLEHKNIKVYLERSFEEYKYNWRSKYKYLIYTGSVDEFYDFRFGKLPYRTLEFKELRGNEIQGVAQLNFTDMSVSYTRICEPKWFMPERKFKRSVAFEEYSKAADAHNDPYYPIVNEESKKIYNKYVNINKKKNIYFIGRLAGFKYYNMDQVIAASMAKFYRFIKL